MAHQDPWHRRRLYDGDIRWQRFIQWTVYGVRLLAVPTALLSLLLVVDVALPGTTDTGVPYALESDSRLIRPNGLKLRLARTDRSSCVSSTDGDRLVLRADRPGCSVVVAVGEAFGKRLSGRDTLQIVRTPLFGQVRSVHRPTDGLQDRFTSLSTIAMYVLLGLVPLLSFGKGFAKSPIRGGADRRFMLYVVPSLIAEAVYLGFFLHVFGLL